MQGSPSTRTFSLITTGLRPSALTGIQQCASLTQVLQSQSSVAMNYGSRDSNSNHKKLHGPGGSTLSSSGTLKVNLSYHGRTMTETVYILSDQPCSLLSKRACVELGIVRCIDTLAKSSTPDFKGEFPGLFSGLGTIDTSYKITAREDARPVCIHAPRKIAHPLIQRSRQLENMEEQGVISPVTKPTSWCSGIVVMLKPNGSVWHLCGPHPPQQGCADESLAKLGQSKIFSKLDAKSGFWQIPLCPESRLLTTFTTPFGHFCFNWLPFGISFASEIFQWTMAPILTDLEGVICHMDDILIHAPEQVAHDQRLGEMLQRLREAGVTLKGKCEFSKTSIKFLGHTIDAKSIHIDPDKVKAIRKFPAPTNITPEVHGHDEPAGKIYPQSSRQQCSTVSYTAQEQIKELLTSPPVLAHYDPKCPTVVAADASNTGIRAVLLQTQGDFSRRPFSFIFPSLIDTEKELCSHCKRSTSSDLGL